MWVAVDMSARSLAHLLHPRVTESQLNGGLGRGDAHPAELLEENAGDLNGRIGAFFNRTLRYLLVVYWGWSPLFVPRELLLHSDFLLLVMGKGDCFKDGGIIWGSSGFD